MTIDDSDGLLERTSLAKERTRLASERNRLANERTFLSWIRTGLAIVGGGIAVMRLLTFEHILHQHMAQVSGMILIILGLSMFVLSAFDYRRSMEELKVFPGLAGSTATILTIVLVLVGVCTTLILALISFQPH